MENDKFISKKIYQSYFKIGFPMMVSHFITYFASNLTIALIGNLSDKAMAGYTVANETYSIFYMLALGITSSFHIFISQYYGEGNIDKVNQIIRYGTAVSLFLGTTYSVLVFVFGRPFVGLYVSDPETIEYALEYLKFFCWTFIPYVLNYLWCGIYSFIGNSKMAMLSNGINCIATVLFSICFVSDVFNMNIGIAGASLALLLARCLEGVFLFCMLNRKDSEFRFSIPAGHLDKKERISILKKGLPLITNELIYSLAYMVIVQSYSYAHEEYLACYTVAYNIGMLNFGAQQACPAIVGFLVGGELGRKDYEKAKYNSSQVIRISAIYFIAQGLILLGLSPFIPKFYSLEGDLYHMAVILIIIRAISGGLSFTVSPIYNILKIGGDTKGVLITDGLYAAGVQMVVSIILSRVISVPFYVLYGAVEGLNIVKAYVNLIVYRKYNWLKKLEVNNNEI